MDNNGDHKGGKPVVFHDAEDAKILLFSELADFVAPCEEVSESERAYLLSALNRTAVLIGDGAADLPADPKVVLRKLERLSPAMAGMKPRSLANLKSRIRRVFQLAGARVAPARLKARLEGEWLALAGALSVRESRRLSRFMRFAQMNGWKPEEISDAHLDRFSAYLRDEVMLDDAAGIVRATARAWNLAADTAAEWPANRLAVPASRRESYWVKPDEWPESLRRELEALLEALGSPNPFLEGMSEPLAPSTVRQYQITIIELVSALVISGVAIETLVSLRVLVTAAHVRTALHFHHRRAGGRVSAQVEMLAYRCHKVARGLSGVPEAELEELRDMCARVAADAPPKCCLTQKNRDLVEKTEDPAFVDRLVTLPEQLMRAAGKARRSRNAAAFARDAVAVELLLTCSMRLGNLVDLRIGETIRKYGPEKSARWMIEIPGEKVKNDQPLRFALMPESERLLETYLAEWHQLVSPGSRWLFPASDGSHVASAHLSNSIAKRTRRHVGARITAHQFRHLMAELYLREDPSGLGVVSQHLAHRNYDTTRRYYAREQTRSASALYHEILSGKRADASSPGRGPGRRPGRKL